MWFSVPGKHDENSPTIRDIREYLGNHMVDLGMFHNEKAVVDQKLNTLENDIMYRVPTINEFKELKLENETLKKTIDHLIMFLQYKEVVTEQELIDFFDAQAVAKRLKEAGEPSQPSPPNEVDFPRQSGLEQLVSAARNSCEQT